MTAARSRAGVSHSVRLGASVGLSAVAAVVAHAGPAGLEQVRWLAVSATGGVVAMAALLTAGWATVVLRHDAARIATGALPTSRLERTGRRPSFLSLAGIMLACQVSAHALLLASGVAPGTGAAGSAAVHVVLAIAGAAIVWCAERALHAARVALERAVAAAIARLLSRIDRPRPIPPRDHWRPHPRGGRVGGRAPPIAAAA